MSGESDVMCVLSCFSHVQLFTTPWTVAHQAPLSMGFSRQDYWSGLPFPALGDLPNSGIKLCLLCLLHWQEGSLPWMPPGKPLCCHGTYLISRKTENKEVDRHPLRMWCVPWMKQKNEKGAQSVCIWCQPSSSLIAPPKKQPGSPRSQCCDPQLAAFWAENGVGRGQNRPGEANSFYLTSK